MAVYLGDSGLVELERDAEQEGLRTQLDPADVNLIRQRFSVDFATGALLTGDLVDIKTIDRTPLELVSGHVDPNGDYFPDWRGYIHVDEVGGIRLFKKFEDAVTGDKALSLQLVQPTSVTQIEIATRNKSFRCLAQVRNYELTTERQQVQVTELGDEFQRQFEAGLISGQGRVECFWEYRATACGANAATGLPEFPHYLAQLVLRLKQGADFKGRFYLHRGSVEDPLAVWYEATCVVVNLGLTVPATGTIDTTIDFVTTGPFALRMGFAPSLLLQEDGSLILQEDGVSGIALEDPS